MVPSTCEFGTNAQRQSINALAKVQSGQMFDLHLPVVPYFVRERSEGSGEPTHVFYIKSYTFHFFIAN